MSLRPQHPFTSALALITAATGWDPSGVFLQPYGPLLPTGDVPGEHDYGAPLGAMVRDADPDSASAQLAVRLTRKRDDGTWEHVWVMSGVGDWRGGTNEAAWVVVDVLRRIAGAQRTPR